MKPTCRGGGARRLHEDTCLETARKGHTDPRWVGSKQTHARTRRCKCKWLMRKTAMNYSTTHLLHCSHQSHLPTLSGRYFFFVHGGESTSQSHKALITLLFNKQGCVCEPAVRILLPVSSRDPSDTHRPNSMRLIGRLRSRSPYSIIDVWSQWKHKHGTHPEKTGLKHTQQILCVWTHGGNTVVITVTSISA